MKSKISDRIVMALPLWAWMIIFILAVVVLVIGGYYLAGLR
jgi:hypothetical protein